MSDSGNKTEQPTPKRLRDARRDGDVPKSKDLSQTVTTLVWTLLLAGLGGFAADRIGGLLDFAWTQTDLASPTAMRDVGFAALKTFALLTLLPLGIVALCGVLADFLQVGALFAPKRIVPQGSRLNPAAGVKRMFSADNLFELAKSVFKTLLLSALLVWLMRHYLPDIMRLPAAGLPAYVGLNRRTLLALGACIAVLFAFVSIADRMFQSYSHRKKLRMSKSDVQREHKEDQGDPQLRGQRKRLHRQWSTQDAREAARNATALLVNPTHIAIAIRYQPEETAVPTITAKGEGHLARLMRREAEDAGVPVIRDVILARTLNFCAEEDDFVPEEFFEPIAAVLASAERMRCGAPPA
jgi:type III secretion protein U